MDTLQVIQASQSGGSRHSSRTPSPSRYMMEQQQQQLSRDRETESTSAGVANTSSSNLRFRNQSPSTTQRRSRERERTDRDTMKEINHSINQSTDITDIDDDSRMTEELLGYPSLDLDLEYTDPNDHNKHSTPMNRHQRTNSLQAIDRLTTKIACTRESIRKEQTARDENVNEYLKLAASADKTQLLRIKAVFEKKNQKSAHIISQLQKKLESYNKRYKDLEQQQLMKVQQQKDYKPPREVLRDVSQGLKNVGGNIRDGVSTVMAKPREFAHLIKNKFGSADNINQMASTSWYTDQEVQEHQHDADGTAIIENNQAQGQASSNNLGGNSSGKFSGEHDSECSSVTSDSAHGLFLKCKHTTGSGSGGAGNSNKDLNQTQQVAATLKHILDELKERKEDFEKLKAKVERLEATQKDLADLSVTLDSERYRAERLESQINDLTELHQTEIENLKQAMADMEEKVQYQSDERLRDVNEVLENCQTRIQKMEHLSQQQYVTVEGIDNSNARALVVKLINVVLTVLQVVLLLTATAAGILMPFLKTRVRVLTTVIFILFIIFIVRAWPDVRETGIILFHKIVK